MALLSAYDYSVAITGQALFYAVSRSEVSNSINPENPSVLPGYETHCVKDCADLYVRPHNSNLTPDKFFVKCFRLV